MIGSPPLPMECRRASKAQESLGGTMTGRRMALVATAAMVMAAPAAAQAPMNTETYFRHVDRFCLAGGGDPALALGLAAAILPVWAFSGTGPYTDRTELMLGGMEAMAAHAATEPVYMLNLMPTDDGTPALGLLRLGE